MPFAFRPLFQFVATTIAIAMAVPAAFANNNNNNNNNSTVTSVTTVQQPKKEGRQWSGLLNASRGTSLVDFKDGTRVDTMDYMGRFNYKIGENYSARVQAGYSQDLNYPESDDFSDTSLSILRSPFKAGKRFLLGYRVGTNIPTSKDSKIRQNLQGTFSTSLSVVVNPDVLIPGLEISGGLGGSRNFHQFETGVDGRVNAQYSANQTLAIAYGFQSGISLSLDVIHRNTWSYQNVMRDSFEATQELGYQLNPTLAFALGHTNTGSSLRPNGQDSNVQLIDENKSVAYGSVTVIF